MKILSSLLLLLTFNYSIAWAGIEVYSAGRHFSSFEDYQKDKTNIIEKTINQSDEVAKPRQIVIPPQDRKKLDKISYNNAVDHMIIDFQQNWQNPKPRFIMDVEELQDTIRDALQAQNGPVLLVSDPKKLRMMAYSTNREIKFTNPK